MKIKMLTMCSKNDLKYIKIKKYDGLTFVVVKRKMLISNEIFDSHKLSDAMSPREFKKQMNFLHKHNLVSEK